MDDITKYTKDTPIKDIIEDVLWESYNKHSDLSYSLLNDEIDIVDKALRQFAKEIGIIETSNKKLELICFSNSPSYIKFYDINNDFCYDYYSLSESDTRYIDIQITKWFKK